MEEFEKVIRDPVYGYIGITKEQLAVIELPIFQRLRRITQLSFGDLVYPNATHNRFSHSLGVMHLARLLINYLESSGLAEKLKLTKKEKEAFIWAGLLHDIGHLPFSHVCEEPFAYFMPGFLEFKEYHTGIGCHIISKPEFGITPIIGEDIAEMVCKLLKGIGHPLLTRMLDGLVSIDRLDYLQRDALHAGTPEYAIVDAERIVNSLVIYPEDPLLAPVFRKKALYSLEGVVLSYFFLYRAIYYHHTVRAAYLLFQNILWEAFQNGLKEKLEENNWLTPSYFPNFDDHCLMALLRGIDVSRKALEEELLYRKLPKMIPPEKLDIYSSTIGIYFYNTKDKILENKVKKEEELEERLKKFNIKRILLDSPLIIPYPRSLLSERLIYIWGEKDDKPQDIGDIAPHLRATTDAAEKQMSGRVYVYPDLRDNEDFIRDLKVAIREILR
jgi:HD superfamily phosphohydrolase